MKPLILLICLSSCAPQVFQEQGVTFVPEPRSVVEAAAPKGMAYRVDAVAIRGANLVLVADDAVISQSLRRHELKHFRPDPESPTGFCEHLPDGRTWLNTACQK